MDLTLININKTFMIIKEYMMILLIVDNPEGMSM